MLDLDDSTVAIHHLYFNVATKLCPRAPMYDSIFSPLTRRLKGKGLGAAEKTGLAVVSQAYLQTYARV
ncbi:hypothetical protein M3J09_006906 [Ascochyta lentis]